MAACHSRHIPEVEPPPERRSEPVRNRLLGLWLPWALVACGVALRVWRLVENRSLRMDEVRLALNIINRSPAELFGRLDFHQSAPVGFLLLEKLVITVLPLRDWALRLLPCVAGCVALILLCLLARSVFNTAGLLMAVGFAAFSWRLVFYSAEVKQYSGDVALTLAILLLGNHLLKRQLTPARASGLMALGAVAVWLSNPAVFVLAGVGATLVLSRLPRDRRGELGLLGVVAAVWLVSFVTCYLLNLRVATGDPEVLAYWNHGFAPFPPQTLSDWSWYPNTLGKILHNQVMLRPMGVAALALLLGLARFIWRDRLTGVMLLAPIPFAVAASAAGLFPFADRVSLYIVPIAILLAAAGVDFLDRSGPPPGRLAAVLVTLFLVFPHVLRSPRMPEEWNYAHMRPVVHRLNAAITPGDVVFVYGLKEGYDYYSLGIDHGPRAVITATRGPKGSPIVLEELDGLVGDRRVWVVFANRSWPGRKDLRPIFRQEFDRRGKHVRTFAAHGVTAHLYDMSG